MYIFKVYFLHLYSRQRCNTCFSVHMEKNISYKDFTHIVMDSNSLQAIWRIGRADNIVSSSIDSRSQKYSWIHLNLKERKRFIYHLKHWENFILWKRHFLGLQLKWLQPAIERKSINSHANLTQNQPHRYSNEVLIKHLSPLNPVNLIHETKQYNELNNIFLLCFAK